jgi:hypothetical protein
MAISERRVRTAPGAPSTRHHIVDNVGYASHQGDLAAFVTSGAVDADKTRYDAVSIQNVATHRSTTVLGDATN